MARARKISTQANDGMSLLQIMPFPALNPWNWWALSAPNNSMLAAMQSAFMGVQAWRSGADACRAALRQQQDLLLDMCQGQLAQQPEAADETVQAEASPANEAGDDAPDFVTPMLDATRAYSRVGRAFIVAQRNTMRAFTQPGKPN